MYLYAHAPRKILLFGGGIYPLYRTRAVVSMGSQSGNGRPNLGSVKAAITIHFISSSLLFSVPISALSFHLLSFSLIDLVHHLSSTPFSSRPFTSSLLFSSLLFYLLYPLLLSSTLTASHFFLLNSSPHLLQFFSPLF